MWIRSQNKVTLVNVTHIEYSGPDNSHMWVIRSYNTQTQHNANLGFYSTKAKALKVLDMIQKNIIFLEEKGVVIMPQDDEV